MSLCASHWERVSSPGVHATPIQRSTAPTYFILCSLSKCFTPRAGGAYKKPLLMRGDACEKSSFTR